VTSSITRLDKVVDKLSSKIASDEQELAKSLDSMGILLEKIQDLRRRIATNKTIRQANNDKLDNDVRHLVESESNAALNEGLSASVDVDRSLRDLGMDDLFDWSFEPFVPSESPQYVVCPFSISVLLISFCLGH